MEVERNRELPSNNSEGFDEAFINSAYKNNVRAYLIKLIITAGYESVSELKKYVCSKNNDNQNILDKVLIIMEEHGIISVNGDQITLKRKDTIKNKDLFSLKEYLSNSFSIAVNKTLDDHIKGEEVKKYETAKLLTFPADENVMAEVKQAYDELNDKLMKIMKKADEQNLSTDTIFQAGFVTSKITPEVF